jgi:hypothetical protein
MRTWRRLLLCISIACAAERPALAEDPNGAGAVPESREVVQAREEFVLGAAFAKRGQWLDAVEAFQRSATLRPHPVSTYNIGYCERALRRYTRARKRFVEALEQHGSGRDAMPDAMRVHAANHLAEAERRVARVVVTVEGADTIAVDGRPLEPAGKVGAMPLLLAGTRDHGRAEPPPARTFEVWVDPGRHVVVLSRAGRPDTVTTHDFTAGATTMLQLEAAAGPAAPATSADARGAPISEATWPIVLFGVGGVGLAIGSVFGVATLRKKSELDDICGLDGKTCPPGSEPEQAAIEDYAAVSTVGFGFALAGAAAGTLWLLLSQERASDKQRSVRGDIRPTVGGLRGSF